MAGSDAVLEGMEEPDPEHRLAVQGFNLLANGMGGIDWAGFPLVVALLGIDDIELFIHRLLVIKRHTPDKDD